MSTVPEPSLADIEAMLARTLDLAGEMERLGGRLLAEAAVTRKIALSAQAATGTRLVPASPGHRHLRLALPPAG